MMRRLPALAIACLLSFLLSIGFSRVLATPSNPPSYQWDLPDWTPRPIVPEDNPMSQAKVELGRHLFYEKRLSITGDFSCGSCHLQSRAFTDGKPVSVGATGELHPRNAMSLANMAYNSVLTWANPLMTTLEQQGLVPLFGEHPIELGMVGRENEILSMLRDDPQYREMFAAAFGAGDENINVNHLMKAIASFERSLVSFNSPYDRYRYDGERNAISESAKRGEALFHSERFECFHCHGGLNFSDSIMHERLAFREIAFHNTGLYNLDGNGAYPSNNTGVYEITHNPADMGHFKAPTLRNIERTAPYMHDGSVATLEEAIAHYQAGGRTIDSGPHAGVGRTNPLKSQFIIGFELTELERQDLLAFLRSLTDETFIHNPAFSDPHNEVTSVVNSLPIVE
ncbi:MbnH family di-heme enzyme [Egbenema bharatensis]|uniref:MbnH family di-heme enzyme n=1 Tax=Egbenema bharatensis TaxID=3463334 RepID=UPI003A8672CF